MWESDPSTLPMLRSRSNCGRRCEQLRGRAPLCTELNAYHALSLISFASSCQVGWPFSVGIGAGAAAAEGGGEGDEDEGDEGSGKQRAATSGGSPVLKRDLVLMGRSERRVAPGRGTGGGSSVIESHWQWQLLVSGSRRVRDIQFNFSLLLLDRSSATGIDLCALCSV
jgi:hypothetical protein